jgi:Ca2+-binding RTX toxin-like protein
MGDGNDLLNADLEDDWLAGGAGSDSIHGAGGADRIWGVGPGNFGAVDIDYIGMTLNGTDDGLGDDRLYGDAGDDTIVNSLGNDTLNGGADNDTASYDNYDDGVGQPGVTIKLNKNIQETGVSGQDRFVSIENVFGSGSDDFLKGADGDNVINGSRGNDTIRGGLGGDTLTGGAGADFFVYKSVDESGGVTIDLITDLNFADRLDLRGIDAKATKAGNQAFEVVGAFTGHEGELVRTFDGTLTIVELDTNGDMIADGYITMTGDVPDDFFIL